MNGCKKRQSADPDHPWVALFLGYQFFDDGRYLDAYAELARVDQQYFASIKQQWRNLKTDELLLVALLRGESPRVSFERLKRLTDRYTGVEEIDRPAPAKIVRALSESPNRDRFDVSSKEVAAEAARLIRGANQCHAFASELAAFDAVAKAVE